MHEHWLRSFEDPDTYPIDEQLVERMRALEFENKSIAQLNCNNGRELISLRLLGAGRCVGFDISGGALSEARDLDAAREAGCEFVKADCQSIADVHLSGFDIVLVTAGALCFIPSLDKYFRGVFNLLTQNGKALVYEAHPFLNMFAMDRDREGAAVFRFDYFNVGPMRHCRGLDYHCNVAYDGKEIFYFLHSTADIVTDALRAGLSLDRMDEIGFDPSRAFDTSAFPVGAPMGLILEMSRASGG